MFWNKKKDNNSNSEMVFDGMFRKVQRRGGEGVTYMINDKLKQYLDELDQLKWSERPSIGAETATSKRTIDIMVEVVRLEEIAWASGWRRKKYKPEFLLDVIYEISTGRANTFDEAVDLLVKREAKDGFLKRNEIEQPAEEGDE